MYDDEIGWVGLKNVRVGGAATGSGWGLGCEVCEACDQSK